jgi:tetratricopeptide (TPR) repeat protein
MYGLENCPRCLQAIAPERLLSTPKICDCCGFVINNVEKQEQKQFERRSLIAVIASAVLIVAGFVHVVNWGGYSLEILPIQAASFIGMESQSSTKRMAEICLDVKKLDCVESMYVRLALSDASGWVRLGKFQFNRSKYPEAAESFRQFFAKGGQDLDASYVYARALGETGRVDEASKYFEYVLAAKPDILQVTVAQNYVKLLVGAGRYDQALKVIDAIRKKGENASQFMDSEYKVIREKMGSHS